MRGLQVAQHVCGLLGGSESEKPAGSVVELSGFDGVAMRDAADDELGGVPDACDRCDVRPATALRTDEGEEESEDDGYDRDAHVLFVLKAEDEAGEEDGGDDAAAPHPHWDLFVRGSGIVDDIFLINLLSS